MGGAEYGIGKQEQLEGQHECEPEGSHHEGNVEIVNL